VTPGHATHRYTAQLTWAGSTAEGYDHYSRAHEATCASDAEGEMPEDDRPMRITRIVLRPRITITGDAPDDARLMQLVETAHRHCFIANSLTTEIAIEPSFRRVPA
jgi:organic hydroperoxide reductase OsmC/OhrA